jgi:cytochrome P450 family 117 subfamily A
MILNPLSRKVRMHQAMPIMPGAFPVIGHLPAVLFGAPELLDHAAQKLGTHFWIDFGSPGLALICTQAETFDLFKNKDTTSAFWQHVGPGLGTAMLAQDGAMHRNLRAHVNEPFLPKGLTASRVGELFTDLIIRRIEQWIDRPEIPVVRETSELVISLLFCMLGIKESEESVWNEKLWEYVFTVLLPISVAGRRVRLERRSSNWIDAELRVLVQDARSRPGASGVLAAIVRAFDNDDTLTEADLIDNLRFVLPAGHDSTSATMAQIVMQLARRPDVWDALCNEALTMGSIPQNPKELAKFPYAEALFRETLRCYPAAPLVLRRVVTDIKLSDKSVAAGSLVAIPILYLSRCADLYRQPGKFLPERWLGRTEIIRPIESVQFGSGPHRCLGYHVAWMEIVQFSVALALIMGARRLRPHLLTSRTRGLYFPIAYPPFKTRIVFR